jgi:hypothetical protein
MMMTTEGPRIRRPDLTEIWGVARSRGGMTLELSQTVYDAKKEPGGTETSFRSPGRLPE